MGNCGWGGLRICLYDDPGVSEACLGWHARMVQRHYEWYANALPPTDAAFGCHVVVISWQMLRFPDGTSASRKTPRPAEFFRREGATNSSSQTSPIMLQFSNVPGGPKASAPSFEVDLAAFLLVRGVRFRAYLT